MSVVTANRIVPADPASTALLLSGPTALEFWPGVDRIDGMVSPLEARASLGGDPSLRLTVRSTPPRRTPTAYVSAFSVAADGLPTASGTLRVTRQGWLGDVAADLSGGHPGADGVALVQFELRTDVDYDGGLADEIAASAEAFLDNIAAFAGQRAGAA